jgi:hypothetical protein
MRKNLVLGASLFAAAVVASGCFNSERKSSTSPTTTGSAALLGSWSSASAVPSPTACSDFRWNVTEQTGTTARGTFSATCPGDIRVSGMASGMLSGSSITWNANATASVPNLPSCPITLSGTAELGIDSIRVPYSGETCLGRVSGVEVLRKN